MSLLINGMDMPDGCRHCRFCIPTEPDCDDSPYECVLNDYLHWTTWMEVPIFVSEGCKLIKPRTHHGRLIDADVIMDLLEKSVPKKNRGHQFYVFRHMLRNAPTVIEAEG